ncbi:lipase family protein [Campylobacter troglodytis]|uniref:lipase family protein n=1 Tax=Campylobacter troglodytis TaxID=654363 RepID=UPI00115C400F|nr:Mbeg1-like protein [Campylobacter troglodytis]TQR59075.1 hypothetical protein DMC01_07345 [Campylobacter troglodytis]
MQQTINNLKDYAELAHASYFYFDLLKDSKGNSRKIYELDSDRKKIKDKNYTRGYKELILNLEHIVSSKYSGQEVLINLKQDDTWQSKLLNSLDEKCNLDTTNGEFGEIQAKNFLERYILLKHCPNTETGFSATLFQNKFTKTFIFAIRGTKGILNRDLWISDMQLLDQNVPNQYKDMLHFYQACLDTYPQMKEKQSLTLTGHSLGGTLAQLLALSLCTANDRGNIKEVYTFNAPGAKDLKPAYDLIIYVSKPIKEDTKEGLLSFYRKQVQAKAKELKINAFDLNAKIDLTLQKILYNQNNANTYFGICISSKSSNANTGLEYANITYEKIPNNLFKPYQTLSYNYNNKEGYKLAISDKVFHIETKDQVSKKHHSKKSHSDNAIQHLGKDIDGNYFILNLNFNGFKTHKIIETIKILYFYQYIYHTNKTLIDKESENIQVEYKKHKKDFMKTHSVFATDLYTKEQKVLEYCNLITLSIYKILYNIEARKAAQGYINNDLYRNEAKNPLYAIIEQRLFEASLKTKEKKFKLKEDCSNIIEAILYLQNNFVFIKILEEEAIKKINKKSELALLFAIHEESFFITVNEQAKPLITKENASSLMGYKTPKMIIFCLNGLNDDGFLIEALKKETLKFYPKVKSNEESIQSQ